MTSPGPGDPVYDKLVGLSTRMDVMLSRMDSMIAIDADHEARLRQLEQARWPIANLTVVVGVMALLVAVAVAVFGRH